MQRIVCLKNILLLTGLLILIVASSGTLWAREVQLAGMRLGQHAINLLDVYGQPDGVVVGEGPEFAGAAGAAAPGIAGMPGMGGMPGMPSPLMGPGAMAPPAMGVGGPGAMPGGVAAGVPGAPAAAAGGVFPIWALPVWVEIKAREVEWLYQRGPVVLGFVLDRDGYIQVIAVAAENCDYARTHLWQPHKFIKLGDSFQQLLYRYGWPDESLTFSYSGPGAATPGTGSLTVSFGGTSRVFSRDVMLRYTEDNNIAFTLHDMTVTRIHIWD